MPIQLSTPDEVGQFIESLASSNLTSEAIDEKAQVLVSDAKKLAETQDPEDTDPDGRKLDNYTYGVVSTLVGVIMETPPERQKNLVEFVLKLQQIECHDKNGRILETEGGNVWTDLPTFSWTIRDCYNFDFEHLLNDPDPLGALNKSEVQQARNLAAFLAQTTQIEHNSKGGGLDYSLYALWDLRFAFEEREIKKDTLNEKAFATATMLQASEWMLGCPEVLRDLSRKGVDQPERCGVAGDQYISSIGREWRGFNEERWQLWKDGFQDAQSWVVGEGSQEKIKRVLEKIANL
ncbi:hypothetical protein QBC35DRAFT_447670 [Podospora australis]|uniref:Uncharacterized protein n=1 Tax=Podospora australis TaxID=1536484 RepID=A0AAN6X2D2_9PEZI|nr:hypothetical protein QBC35DRAFT_447670 [Podospora australis]